MVKVPLWRWGSRFVAVLALLWGMVGAAASPPLKVWQKVYDGPPSGTFVRSDDGRVAVSGGDDGSIWVWNDEQPGRQIRKPGVGSGPWTDQPTNISSDNRYVLMQGSKIYPEVVELASGESVTILNRENAIGYLDLVFGFKQNMIYYASSGTVKVVEVNNNKALFEDNVKMQRPGSVYGCVKSDGTFIYEGSDKVIHVAGLDSPDNRHEIDLNLVVPNSYVEYAYSCELDKNLVYLKIKMPFMTVDGGIQEQIREVVYDYVAGKPVKSFAKNTFTSNEKPFTYLLEKYGLKEYPLNDAECEKDRRMFTSAGYNFEGSTKYGLFNLENMNKILALCTSERTNYLKHSMSPTRMIYLNGRLEYYSDFNGPLVVRDASSQRAIRIYGDKPALIAESPCRRFNAIVMDSVNLVLQQVSDGVIIGTFTEQIRTDGHQLLPVQLTWSSDGTRISLTAGSEIVVWYLPPSLHRLDCQSDEPQLTELQALQGEMIPLTPVQFLQPSRLDDNQYSTVIIRSLNFSSDSTLLALGLIRGDVELWSADKRTLRYTFTTDRHTLLNLAWSPDSTRLAASNEAGQVWVHDLNTKQTVGSGKLSPQRTTDAQTLPTQWIRESAWNPAGTQLAIAGSWGELYLWTPGQAPVKLLTTSDKEGFTTVSWLTAGKLLLGQLDGQVKVVSASDGQVLRSWAAGADAVLSLTISGSDVTTLTRDKVLTRWRLGK